jgi:hypothetical protein
MTNPLVERIERLFQFIGEQATMAEFEALGCSEDNVRFVMEKLRGPGGFVEAQVNNPVLFASLTIMENLKRAGRIGKSARPTVGFTREERHRLLDLVGDSAKQFCVTHDVTEASLGAALMGRPIALATAAQLRTLLGAV